MVFPVWQLMKQHKLNGVKIICYCPGNSKDHPAETGNRTLKVNLKGHIIPSKSGSEQDFDSLIAAKNVFTTATHAGEFVSAFIAEKKNPFIPHSISGFKSFFACDTQR